MSILINKEIPRTMTLAGLEYLGRMAKTVPENGLIVEVGPLFGSSTWVLAKNSHPSVRVVSIDTWEPDSWIDKIEEKFPGCRKFSKETFLHYTSDCDNVEAVQGWSPAIMAGRNEPIDMFFDDATHGDPGFTESLNHYVPLVKHGGIICGDDFASGWPDIVNNVYTLAEKMNTSPEVCGRVWSMLKMEESGNNKPVYDILEKDDLEISVSTRNNDGNWSDGIPNMWAGKLHRLDVLTGLKIVANSNDSRDVDGQYQVRYLNGSVSRWVEFGEQIEMGQPIAAVRAHLTGHESKQLTYQVCGIDLKKRKTRNSKNYTDGDWASLDGGPSPVTAVRFALPR